jgi:5-methylcytosine-specific restriction endonuclease McrA
MRIWKSPFRRLAYEVRGKRRHYGGSWSRLSKTLRENNPLCQSCGQEPSTEVHHVVPVAVDQRLKLDPRNLLAVCRRCHERLEHGK